MSDSLITRNSNSFVSDNLNIPSSFRNTNVLDTPVSIKTSSGNLYGYNVYNPNTYDVFVKLYDSSNPVVGITACAITLQVPAQGSIVFFGCDIIINFATALKVAIVTGYTDSSTGPAASGCIVQIMYK